MTINDIGPQAGNQVTTRPARATSRGAARTWFAPCSTPAAKDGTVLDADWFNDLTAQLRQVFDSSGIVVDGADDMLWRAIKTIGLRAAEDTGGANAVVITNTTPVTALYFGLPIIVQFAATPTGATTIKVDALAPVQLNDAAGDPLQKGAFKAGEFGLCVCDGANFRILGMRKHPGFTGTATGMTCTDLLFNFVSPSSAAISTLGTSTYSNGTFTCGAGEAGWWQFGMTAEYSPGVVSDFSVIAAYISGPGRQFAQHNVQGAGNQGNVSNATGAFRLAVGEQVTFSAYRLAGSGVFASSFYGVRLGA